MDLRLRKTILAITLIGTGSINIPAQAVSGKKILAGLGTVFFGASGVIVGTVGAHMSLTAKSFFKPGLELNFDSKGAPCLSMPKDTITGLMLCGIGIAFLLGAHGCLDIIQEEDRKIDKV